ncbi:MAG: amidohydrolase [Acidobacteria bacterium]|nr:amidohydrolase [Acidobacteriota bacterium]
MTHRFLNKNPEPGTRNPVFENPEPGIRNPEIEAIFPKLVEIRRDLHRHPELSNREVRTSKIVAQFLTQLGLEVTTGVAHHGVVGILRGKQPGPVVAVRADMDALPIQEIRDVPYKSCVPGVMHACGHDVHTTIGLGTAEILAKHTDQLGGTVKFLFQPAEEGAPVGEDGGAKMMIREGVLENPSPEVIFGLHVYPPLEAGKIGYVAGPAMAGASRFEIKIKGKKAHGAYPHTGVDAVLVASHTVVALQNISSRMVNSQDPVVITVGSIHGGNRGNILADEVVLIGTVRALSDTVMDETERRMRQIVTGLTSGFGAEYELGFVRQVPALVNDPELTERLLPTFERIVGKANTIQTPPRMGAEDFAFFAAARPSLFFSLGIANAECGITAGIHTPEFDVDENCLKIGVAAMAGLVLDFGVL